MTTNFPHRIELCRFGEYKSKSSGREYLVGYLGGAKVIILCNPSETPPSGAMASWTAFIEQAPKRQKTGKAGAPQARPAITRPKLADGDTPPWE